MTVRPGDGALHLSQDVATQEVFTQEGSGQIVPAVTRATRVLEALVASPEGASLTVLAERCSLPKSTASNLLRTMDSEGFVTYDPGTRKYNLGPVLVDLGLEAVTRTTLVTEAKPFMERLVAQTQLACLAIQPMPDGHFTAIAKIESRKAIKVTIEVGARFHDAPLLGRLHRAWSAGEVLRDHDLSELDHLAAIRAQGFGVVFGEYRPELNVVGFPIFNRDGRPGLYIALLGIGDDLTPSFVAGLSDYVVEAARAITTRSGGTIPQDYPLPGAAELRPGRHPRLTNASIRTEE